MISFIEHPDCSTLPDQIAAVKPAGEGVVVHMDGVDMSLPKFMWVSAEAHDVELLQYHTEHTLHFSLLHIEVSFFRMELSLFEGFQC